MIDYLIPTLIVLAVIATVTALAVLVVAICQSRKGKP